MTTSSRQLLEAKWNNLKLDDEKEFLFKLVVAGDQKGFEMILCDLTELKLFHLPWQNDSQIQLLFKVNFSFSYLIQL